MAAPLHVDGAVCLKQALKDINAATGNIESFLTAQSEVAERFRFLTKTLYDFTKKCEGNSSRSNSEALSELVIEDFDDEQIWQELELQNTPCLDEHLKNIASALSKKNADNITLKHSLDCFQSSHKEESLLDTTSQSQLQDSDSEDFASPESESEDNEDEEEEEIKKEVQVKSPTKLKTSGSTKSSVVDDKFFKLSELEAFLNEEDRRDERRQRQMDVDQSDDDDDEAVDLFADIPSGEELSSDDEGINSKSAREATYEDFFDPPDGVEEEEEEEEDEEEEDEDAHLSQDIKEEPLDEDDEEYDTRDADAADYEDNDDNDRSRKMEVDDDEGEVVQDILGKDADRGKSNLPKSSFEQQQERLKKQIKEFEESNLQEKPWPLLGEVTADMRPENSALEVVVKYDSASRPVPVMTQEDVEMIERHIIQRIKDKAWDSVERKIKPKEEPFEYRRRVTLDQEKSKLSLAEVYEKEYIKQQQKEKQEEELPEHTAIKSMMSSLFSKLDALSNFHFTPKAPAPEVKVVNNLPAITVEDVAPVSASDAALLAPEEIKEKPKGELKGATERTETDKKRERRLKKKLQKQKFEAKRKRESAQLQKPTKKMFKDKKKNRTKVLKSSKEFFEKLQDEVTNKVQEKRAKKKAAAMENAVSGVKLKL